MDDAFTQEQRTGLVAMRGRMASVGYSSAVTNARPGLVIEVEDAIGFQEEITGAISEVYRHL